MASEAKAYGSDYDYIFKLLIIGDSGVGKSSLMLRFADNMFSDNHIATIGVDFKIRTVEIQSKQVKLQIWDTAGQDRFKVITANYYRSADAIMLVYDISDHNTFKNIDKWLEEITRCASDNVLKVLVGNKSDFSPSKRVVAYETGLQYAKQRGMKFLEASAKSNTNVEQVFLLLAEDLKNRNDTLPKSMKESFHLGHQNAEEIKKKEAKWYWCCAS